MFGPIPPPTHRRHDETALVCPRYSPSFPTSDPMSVPASLVIWNSWSSSLLRLRAMVFQRLGCNQLINININQEIECCQLLWLYSAILMALFMLSKWFKKSNTSIIFVYSSFKKSYECIIKSRINHFININTEVLVSTSPRYLEKDIEHKKDRC